MDGRAGAVGGTARAPEELLRSAVLALTATDRGGDRIGTGFAVAPQVVATCAHVVADKRDTLPARVCGVLPGAAGTVELVPVPTWYFGADEGGPDLAFLWSPQVLPGPAALLCGDPEIGDSLLTYGHPGNMFRGGESATFRYEGPSRLDGLTVHRAFGTPVTGGFSGSPVLNRRTGAVCGMLAFADQARGGGGSAHMIGAADIVRFLPEEPGGPPAAAPDARWLGTLTDAQIRAGGWPFPGPRLRAYLAAAVRLAVSAAHPGFDAADPPDISALYVDQRLVRSRPDRPAGNPVRARDVFGQAEDAVVFGGPGLGKSTLLRMGLLDQARAWLDGGAAPTVPVWIQATDLMDDRRLPELIAAGAQAALSSVGTVHAWEADFFGAEPLRAVRWLVLVDGLDVLVDAEARRGVLRKLSGAAQEAPELYRFIVASRPLSGEESGSGWPAARYELQPLAASELDAFVERFAGQRGAQAGPMSRFPGELRRAGLSGIAGIPLLAAMLCRIRTADPARRLPDGLAAVYERFVEILTSRQYSPDIRGIYAQANKYWAQFGPQASAAAAEVVGDTVDLLTRLALARRDGDRQPAPDLWAHWTAAKKPRATGAGPWRGFMEDLLRRSGLVAEHQGDYVFVHDTIADYLAVRAIVADDQRSLAAFSELFTRRPEPPMWRPPSWSYSFTRFLITGWGDNERVRLALRRVAREGSLPGCELVASLYADGILDAGEVVAAACATLARLAAGGGFAGRRAMELLERFGAADTLFKVMTGERSSLESRRLAAAGLAGLGDGRGVDRLVDLVSDAEGEADDRFDAWLALREIDRGQAAQLFALIVTAVAADRGNRKACQYLLGRLGLERGIELLAEIAAHDALPPQLRDAAAQILSRRGDIRGWRRLVVQTGALPSYQSQLAALGALAERRDRRALSRLRAAAADATLGGQVRVAAIGLLGRFGEADVSALAFAVASNSGLGRSARRQAVRLLDDADAAGYLVELAKNPDPDIAAYALNGLIEAADENDVRMLISLARDRAARIEPRMIAAEAVDVFGHQEAADIWFEIATDTEVEHERRHEAAGRAMELGDERAAAVLAGTWDEPVRRVAPKQVKNESDFPARVRLFVQLAAPGHPAGPADADADEVEARRICRGVLARWAGGQEHTGRDVRRAAAAALVSLGDPRGPGLAAQVADRVPDAWQLLPGTVDVCMAMLRAVGDAGHGAERPAAERSARLRMLARYPETPFRDRRYAAETMARLGEIDGNLALLDLVEDENLPHFSRIQAAASLGRAGDSRGVDFLRLIAGSDQYRRAVRQEARRWLIWLGTPVRAGAATRAFKARRRYRADGFGDATKDLLGDLGLALGMFIEGGDPGAAADVEARIAARRILARFSDPAAVDALVAKATDPHVVYDARRTAIHSLAVHGASERLCEIAENPGCPVTVRCWAALEASALAEPRALDCLAGIVADPAADSYTRRSAARCLAELGDRRGAVLLGDLATDPGATVDARQTAAQLLRQVRGGADVLAAIVLDPDRPPTTRANALDVLANHGTVAELSALRDSPALPPDLRARVARAVREADREAEPGR